MRILTGTLHTPDTGPAPTEQQPGKTEDTTTCTPSPVDSQSPEAWAGPHTLPLLHHCLTVRELTAWTSLQTGFAWLFPLFVQLIIAISIYL